MNKTKIFKYVSDLFFPNRCPFCGSFIQYDDVICEKCEKELPYAENCCAFCGKDRCCCFDGEHIFKRGFAVCFYDGIAEKGIFKLKQGKGENSAEFFGTALADKIKAEKYDADMITFVPMEAKKKAERGYNQAELIAVKLAEELELPLADGLILRNNVTVEQHTLTAKKRAEFAEKAYSAGKTDGVKEKKIIICDDVITTGSTIDRCAELLIDAGASEVAFATACTTILHNEEKEGL